MPTEAYPLSKDLRGDGMIHHADVILHCVVTRSFEVDFDDDDPEQFDRLFEPGDVVALTPRDALTYRQWDYIERIAPIRKNRFGKGGGLDLDLFLGWESFGIPIPDDWEGPCPECDGLSINEDEPECETCDSTGRIVVKRAEPTPFDECPECVGVGEYNQQDDSKEGFTRVKCDECNGSGKIALDATALEEAEKAFVDVDVEDPDPVDNIMSDGKKVDAFVDFMVEWYRNGRSLSMPQTNEIRETVLKVIRLQPNEVAVGVRLLDESSGPEISRPFELWLTTHCKREASSILDRLQLAKPRGPKASTSWASNNSDPIADIQKLVDDTKGKS
jgi:hypothetical protein